MSFKLDCYGDSILALLEAIQLHFDFSQLKSRLRKCQSVEIRKWKDENSLDLLHHCILENNMGAVILLLEEGHFKPPYEPAVWPYLHMIACLGHRSIISVIVQEIKFHNDAIKLDWNTFDKVINVKIKGCISDFAPEERDKNLSPIDIAGIFKHSSCVELLLDYWQFNQARSNLQLKKMKNSSKSLYLSLSCEAKSPHALRLLLKDHSDKKEALESALRLMSPECVDVVLRDKSPSDVKNAFHGMNLFHVLFSYSSCLSVKQYETMAQVVSVLLRHGQNVNACRPSRTFPLYSLLNHQLTNVSVDDASPCLTAILLLLLNAGSDPNFNEILIEEKLYDNNEYITAFGRRPYSSSIMCVLSAFASWNRAAFVNGLDSEVIMIEKYFYKCIEILLRHGLDLSIVGKFCEMLPDSDMPTQIYHSGTALHLIASLRALHPISYPILRLILHYGVDADTPGSWKTDKFQYPLKFAVNILLFCTWSGFESNPRNIMQEGLLTLNEKDLKLFTYILKFMSQTILYQAFLEFQQAFDQLQKSVEDEEERTKLESSCLTGNMIYQSIFEAYRKELNGPRTLQRCCSHVIWQACRFHMGNVFALPIPKTLRDIIMYFH